MKAAKHNTTQHTHCTANGKSFVLTVDVPAVGAGSDGSGGADQRREEGGAREIHSRDTVLVGLKGVQRGNEGVERKCVCEGELVNGFVGGY